MGTNMKIMAISIQGIDEGDLLEALREISTKVQETYLGGHGLNDRGSYAFSIEDKAVA